MNLYGLFVPLASLSLVSVVPLQHAPGQCRVNEAAKLTASDGDEQDSFGYSVSVSSDVAVFGAPDDLNAGAYSGSAYVYRFDGSTWVEEQKLTASDGATGDKFGTSISVSGDVVVVGAQWDEGTDNDSGSAYVYRFDGSTWFEEQKLTASDAATNDYFGAAVSISGDVVLVGAWFDDDACHEDPHCNSGSAYLYRFDGNMWLEEQKLTASDAYAQDVFGNSVSVSGDVAVVGAHGDNDAGPNSGSAYVYRFNGSTWVEDEKLTGSDAAAFDYFGSSVSISGDVAVVGAYRDDDLGSQSGSAYVYRFDGSAWVEEQKLIAADGSSNDKFGYSVSIDGDVVVVGAIHDGDAGFNSGSAYVYRFDGSTWVQEQKLTASNGAPLDSLGISVSTNGVMAVVGAFFNDGYKAEMSSAYIFGINPVASNPPCGAIDARQPSAPDGSDPAGWDSIALTFDEAPGELNAEDFAVVISPPGDAPSVTDVTVVGNTATVHFDDFIPTEAWTTLTHWPTGAVTRIGYLPADVNNNRFSNANDVLYLIDVLNGVIDPAPPEYQTDTDRSGATNANDVLRVIDLLNGAGAYDEYLDAELPA